MKQNQINTIQEETRKVCFSDLSNGLQTAIVILWIMFGMSILGFIFGIIGALS